VISPRTATSGPETSRIEAAGHLHRYVSFVPDRRESGCRVLDQKPAVALTRVKVGSHLTFEVTCDDGTSDPGTDGQAGTPS
jgi:hypothetical protein